MRLPSALAEKYILIEHLPTKGAEADIFLVQHRSTDDKSIAKVYRRDIECKLDLLERLRSLDSRHVVQIMDHGKSDGHWFELMEYLPLGTLDVYLNRHTPHSEETRRAVLRELHDALKYLHTNGIFHRDLKPENILVREEDPLRLVFSDFGIASLSEASIRFTRGAGTLHYAAPEQIVAAATVTGKTDYWSLGMILFEMLAGRHPFSELGEYAIAAVIATGSTGAGGNLPFEMIADPKWRILCQGLLVRDPQQRWGSDEVGRWLRGDETLKVSPQRPENSNPGYTFNGKKYYDLENLAEALAGDWSNAIKDFHRRYLSSWFSGALFNQELARKADEILENDKFTPDEKVCFLLFEMANRSKIYWKGKEITINLLKDISIKTINGTIESNNEINLIYSSLVSLNNFEPFSKLEKNFSNSILSINNNICEFDKEWNAIVTEQSLFYLKPKRELIIAFFVLLNLDKEFEKKIKQKIFSNLQESIKTHPLIKKLGNPKDYGPVKLFIFESVIGKILNDYNKKNINNKLIVSNKKINLTNDKNIESNFFSLIKKYFLNFIGAISKLKNSPLKGEYQKKITSNKTYIPNKKNRFFSIQLINTHCIKDPSQDEVFTNIYCLSDYLTSFNPKNDKNYFNFFEKVIYNINIFSDKNETWNSTKGEIDFIKKNLISPIKNNYFSDKNGAWNITKKEIDCIKEILMSPIKNNYHSDLNSAIKIINKNISFYEKEIENINLEKFFLIKFIRSVIEYVLSSQLFNEIVDIEEKNIKNFIFEYYKYRKICFLFIIQQNNFIEFKKLTNPIDLNITFDTYIDLIYHVDNMIKKQLSFSKRKFKC